jgi:hypothetical protein
MKKFFFFLSTIALLGLASACVEQISSDNPNYNPERGEVKTTFVFNIATSAATKATADEVQATADNSFRGMEGMVLYMSKGYTSEDYLPAPYQYNLGDLTPTGTITGPIYGDDNYNVASAIDASDSRRVYKMNMPVGVDNMVFYAKAKAKEGSNNKTTYQVTPKKSTTFFELEAIQANADFSSGSAATILGILNSFSSLISEWSTTDDVTLATAFKNYFTTNETLRQASGPAVLRTMQDLYKIVKSADETGTTLAGKIKAAILGNFDATDAGVLSYKTDALKKFPFEDLGLPVGVAQVKCSWTEASSTDPSVPDKFAWINPSNTIADDNSNSDQVVVNAIDVKNIMYPAEICYWADSPIRVSNTEGVEDDENYYPNGVANWDNDNMWKVTTQGGATGNWLDWATYKAVTKDTRAVALKNNVLYGTALAKFIVKMGESGHSEGNNIFLDNRKALVPALSDNKITIDGTNSYFTVTGILIGGQPKRVAWNFLPASVENNKTGVIYDHVFDYTGKLDASKAYYVPVFDNYSSGGTQDVVYFALELENHTGMDFYGKDNVIYDGGKFYLTGKLQLPSGTTISALSDMATKGYRIPPLANDNTMAVTPRIFIQDFVTEITATLGPNALKHAYATIPDLRPIEMYFGLSVDLSWKAGAPLSVEL